MNGSDCNPAGQFTLRHSPLKLRRILSLALGIAAATTMCATDYGAGYRIGVLKGGVLSVKENAFDAPWVVESDNVSSFALEGDRIGIRRRDGSVLVKEGALGAPWVRVGSRLQNFALNGDRIAVLNRRGSLDVKEGALSAPWVRVAERVQYFQLGERKIAIQMFGGSLQFQDGTLDSTLTHVTDSVQKFQLTSQRLGVLYMNGSLELQEGGTDAPWERVATGVQNFYLEGNRVAILRNGVLEVKEGGLSSPWVKIADGVSSFKLSGDRIAVLQNGVLKDKMGGLNGNWNTEAEGVSAFELYGTRILYLNANGTLQAKDGGGDAPWYPIAEGVQKFQLARSGMTGTQTGESGEWKLNSATGEMTKTIRLESPRGRTEAWAKEVDVKFPAGYTYCRHTLSENRRSGPGGVTIVTAEPEHLVFSVWSGSRTSASAPGGVQVLATVTAINDNHDDDSACNPLPVTGGSCGNLSCQHYLDSAEAENGVCLATSCMGGRGDGKTEKVCVYNLRGDDQAETRARLLACRNIMNILEPNRAPEPPNR